MTETVFSDFHGLKGEEFMVFVQGFMPTVSLSNCVGGGPLCLLHQKNTWKLMKSPLSLFFPIKWVDTYFW